MTVPVRVVIPTISSRANFLGTKCLPSVIANNPAEIFVVSGDGGAPRKRNRGSSGTVQPYLLFVDDDSILFPGCIETMVQTIESRHSDFVYSDFNQAWEGGGRFTCESFSPDRLRAGNYIDTTSLIRSEIFPEFDESLERFQDWDLWLTVASRGGVGSYIDHVLFEKHKIDIRISDRIPLEGAVRVIREKHKLK